MSKIHGAWQLKSLVHHCEDGTKSFPFGRAVKGRLVYTRDGFMSVVLRAGNLKAFAKSQPLAGYIAYSSTYKISRNKIIHDVKVSLYPSWERTKQLRFFKLSGSTLVLSTPPFRVNGKKYVAELTWIRVREKK